MRHARFRLRSCCLIVAAGLFGHQNPFKNLAPVAIWVIWWVGFGLVSAFVGNLWPLLNPFAALFDFAEWLASWRGRQLVATMALSGVAWRVAGLSLLLVFAWLELVVARPRRAAAYRDRDHCLRRA